MEIFIVYVIVDKKSPTYICHTVGTLFWSGHGHNTLRFMINIHSARHTQASSKDINAIC